MLKIFITLKAWQVVVLLLIVFGIVGGFLRRLWPGQQLQHIIVIACCQHPACAGAVRKPDQLG